MKNTFSNPDWEWTSQPLYEAGDIVKVAVGIIGIRHVPNVETPNLLGFQTVDEHEAGDFFLVIRFGSDEHRKDVVWAQLLHPLHGLCWARAKWLTKNDNFRRATSET